MYGYPGGFNWDHIQDMTREERTWFLQRLIRQKDEETKAIEKAQAE